MSASLQKVATPRNAPNHIEPRLVYKTTSANVVGPTGRPLQLDTIVQMPGAPIIGGNPYFNAHVHRSDEPHFSSLHVNTGVDSGSSIASNPQMPFFRTSDAIQSNAGPQVPPCSQYLPSKSSNVQGAGVTLPNVATQLCAPTHPHWTPSPSVMFPRPSSIPMPYCMYPNGMVLQHPPPNALPPNAILPSVHRSSSPASPSSPVTGATEKSIPARSSKPPRGKGSRQKSTSRATKSMKKKITAGISDDGQPARKLNDEDIYNLIEYWRLHYESFGKMGAKSFSKQAAEHMNRKVFPQCPEKTHVTPHALETKFNYFTKRHREIVDQMAQSGFGLDGDDPDSIQATLTKKLKYFNELHAFLGQKSSGCPQLVFQTEQRNGAPSKAFNRHYGVVPGSKGSNPERSGTRAVRKPKKVPVILFDDNDGREPDGDENNQNEDNSLLEREEGHEATGGGRRSRQDSGDEAVKVLEEDEVQEVVQPVRKKRRQSSDEGRESGTQHGSGRSSRSDVRSEGRKANSRTYIVKSMMEATAVFNDNASGSLKQSVAIMMNEAELRGVEVKIMERESAMRGKEVTILDREANIKKRAAGIQERQTELQRLAFEKQTEIQERQTDIQQRQTDIQQQQAENQRRQTDIKEMETKMTLTVKRLEIQENAFRQQAVMYQSMGDIEEAKKCLKLARDITEKIGRLQASSSC